MPGDQPTVEIVFPPAGEAPLWVREKWVGLRLPVVLREAKPVRALTAGVLTGPRSVLAALGRLLLGRYRTQRGYAVEVLTAISALEQVSPDAARWWRENTPYLLKPKRCFLFEEKACRVVGRVETRPGAESAGGAKRG